MPVGLGNWELEIGQLPPCGGAGDGGGPWQLRIGGFLLAQSHS